MRNWQSFISEGREDRYRPMWTAGLDNFPTLMELRSRIPGFPRGMLTGVPLTIVDVRGTYHQSQGPMMAQTTAKESYRMLAAVAEGPAGPTFFKLTGPQPTVDHFEESFKSFLDTLRPAQ